MAYKVYFGNYAIYGAESADLSLARPVTVHNGLGIGEFPVPEDQQLRKWSIKGQWTETNDYNLFGWEPAHELIAGLKKMMGSDEPERLVMTNGYDKTSVLVYVTDVNVAEKYPGVYDYTLDVTEYKKTTVKSTGVPAIERPGKIPVMPKTVVFDKPIDIAAPKLHDMEGPQQWSGKVSTKYEWMSPYGKKEFTLNPNMVPMNTPVTIQQVDYSKTPVVNVIGAFGTAWAKEGTVGAAFDAMDKYLAEYKTTIYKDKK